MKKYEVKFICPKMKIVVEIDENSEDYKEALENNFVESFVGYEAKESLNLTPWQLDHGYSIHSIKELNK